MEKQYDIIKIIKMVQLNEGKFLKENKRLPKIGDEAVIVEIYDYPTRGYHLECCSPEGAGNEWLYIFSADEFNIITGKCESDRSN